MKVHSVHSIESSPKDTAQLAKEMRAGLGQDPALVFVFSSPVRPLAELAAEFAASFPAATIMGATTAGEFTEAGVFDRSTVVLGIAGDMVVHAGIGTGLSGATQSAVSSALADIPTEVEGYPHRTAVVLLDPLAGVSEEATLLTAAAFGGNIVMAGGAAGDDLAMSKTHVSLGAQCDTDAIVAAALFTRAPLGVGVCHAHTPISDVLRVTRAEGSTVYEIDGRPAWDVWLEATREHAASVGIDVDAIAEDDVGAYLLRFEAGLATGSEYKIRAPLSKNADGSLAFATGIPQGAEVRITESDAKRQVHSARLAAQRAVRKLQSPAAGAVVFDCICRNLILADEFEEAVAAIGEEVGKTPLAGFETYGEIALNTRDLSGFHNTTTVVLAFPVQ